MLQIEQILQNRYCLKQKLGENTTRQTWLASDLQAIALENSQVIVKLLSFSRQTQWEQLKLFEREAQMLKQLDYPYIPKYRDYFWIDDRVLWFGLVEDYILGTSLEDLLVEGKKFTERQVRQIALDLLNILIYLHELQPTVLHRDIKPSNLIWDRDEQIYLVNFGAVQNKAERSRGTFTVVGTYGYTPIEQFGGRAVAASDLYALGATLIHILTGVSPADLPQQSLRIQFRDRAYTHPTLVSWIERLTEPALENRFSSAREAMQFLISEIQSTEDIKQNKRFLPLPSLEKVAKPHHTRVKLIQADEQLKIQIPRRGIKNLSDGLSAIGYTGILALLCWIFVIKDEFLLAIFLVLLFAPFGIPAIIIIGFLMRNTVRFFSNSVAILNYEKTEIKKQIFGLTYHRVKIFTQAIQSVSISSTDWSSQTARITIISRSDSKRYVRSSFGSSLSEPELIWLVQEIREWLQVAQEVRD